MTYQFDSFFSIIYPTTPDLYYEWLSPSGKTIQWLTENRTSPRPEWMSEEVRDHPIAPIF